MQQLKQAQQGKKENEHNQQVTPQTATLMTLAQVQQKKIYELIKQSQRLMKTVAKGQCNGDQ